MVQRVDVALLPSEATAMEADAFVVVDVLRATTTIAVLFDRGLSDLVVTDDIEAARSRAVSESRLLFGEVGGLRPDGFDYGNSPLEALGAEVAGRGGVLFTTNGSTALCALGGGGGAVYTGAPANASALARRLRDCQRAVIVCAGTEGARRFAQEDFAAAGMLIRVLQGDGSFQMGDAAMLAVRLAGAPERTIELLHRDRTGGEGQIATMPSPGQLLVMTSDHALRLKSLGFERDVLFSAQLDTSLAAPVVVDFGEGWARLANSA